MSQEHVGYPYDFAKEDPIDQWHAIYGRKPVQPFLFDEMMEEEAAKLTSDSPWINGRYALSALVWGLIIMLVVSVMA